MHDRTHCAGLTIPNHKVNVLLQLPFNLITALVDVLFFEKSSSFVIPVALTQVMFYVKDSCRPFFRYKQGTGFTGYGFKVTSVETK